MDSYVYLDYAASAPMVPEAKAAEAAYAEAPYAGANPNSLHTLGREAAMALEGARREIAKALGGGFRPGEIVFTSGGTESNNLALYGIAEGARARDRKRTRVVVSAIEHDSELDVVSALKDRGFAVTLVRAGRDGRIAPEELERAVGPDCALVSIMSANNETGVIQPVAELAEIAHKAGALMHTDAVQAFGRIPLAIDTCDAVSIAAHKIGGPVGIGALALRMRCPFRPQNFGGGQEAGKRPGTQDVRGALAFAAAAKAQTDHLAERRSACAAKANRLFQKICAPGTGIQPSTTAQIDDTRLPGMVSIYVPGLDSETLILKLDQKGFEVSAGSACSSGSLDPSHVLSAMGIARNDALGALRISFDERVSDEDLDRFADALIGIVAANN
ncbi:MAG: cysteine desulfurase family protein [Atopobiaceae bacterium]|nr:cysteine desulfurase family protein [Atopobiaceae bacterium]